MLLTSTVSYANFGDSVISGLVGGTVGSVITNEIYHSNRHTTHRTTYYHTHKSKHTSVPKMTDEKRIQKALAVLSFTLGKYMVKSTTMKHAPQSKR